MKFTQEIKDKWLARLRNPNSKQCYNTYFNHNDDVLTMSYCVWGHLADVLNIDNIAAVGLVDNTEDEKLFLKLVNMNDVEKMSLPQIADYIEANIPAVKE